MQSILMVTVLAALPAAGMAEPVVVPSSGAVPETVQRLTDAIEAAGAQVFGVVDFGQGARSVGGDVGEIQLVIFGVPQIGAQVLAADRMAALDLPGKVLVYDTAEGSAMAYEEPAEMLEEWSIPADAPVLGMMARTLRSLTETAASGQSQ